MICCANVGGYGIPTKCHRYPNATRSDSERRPIRLRTPSDQTPYAIGGYFTPFMPERNAFATPNFRNISSLTGT